MVIEGVTLISPERGETLGPRDVYVRDGRIVSIERALRLTQNVRRIDGRGKFLIPGLIDSHVHIGSPVGLDDNALDQSPQLLADYRSQLPRSYLAFGFTSVVDVDLKPGDRAWFEAAPARPHLYHCGRAVRTAGGYGAMRINVTSDEASMPNLIYEAASAQAWPEGLDPAAWTPARAVERVVDGGGICVKAYVEPGFGGAFHWPTPSPETFRLLRAETRQRHLPLLLHANSVGAWKTAIEAQADIIAHGLWYWNADVTDAKPSADAVEAIEAAAQAGVSVQPTLQVLYGQMSIFDTAILDDPRFAEAMPASVLAYLKSPEGEAARSALAAQYTDAAPNIVELTGVFEERVSAALALMLKNRVDLLFGSDTPSGEGAGNPPGLNGRLEIERWAEAGAPLDQILRAATIDNARAFGLENEIGAVDVGKRADLLLLTKNPLVTAAAYDAIESVIVDGQAIERTALVAGAQ